MRINKIIFSVSTIALIAVVSLLLFSPYYFGRIFEKKIKHQLSTPHFTIAGEPVKLLSYQRGWFHSIATIDIHFKQLGRHLQVKLDINHGPYLWLNGTRHGLATGLANVHYQLSDKLNKPSKPHNNLLQASGNVQIKLNDDIIADGKIPPFIGSFSNAVGQEEIKWQGLSGTLRLTGQKKLHIALKSTPLSSTYGKQRLHIGKWQLQGDYEKSTSGFWLGAMSLQLNGTQITNDTKTVLSIKQLTGQTTLLQQDKQLKTELVLQAQTLDIAEHPLGPVTLTSRLSHIDVPSLQHLRDQLHAIANDEPMAQLPVIMQHGPVFFKHSLQVHHSLEISQPAGKILLTINNQQENIPVKQWSDVMTHASIQIPEVTAHEILTWVNSADGGRGFVENFPGYAGFTANKPAQRASDMLQWLKCADYVKQQGSDLLSNLSYQNGHLLVNGKELVRNAACLPQPVLVQTPVDKVVKADPRIPPGADDKAIAARG